MLPLKASSSPHSTYKARSSCALSGIRPLSHWQGLAARRPANWTIKSQAVPQSQEPEQFEGLLPEEDQEVPGSYWDALNGNTKLGKAVRSACEELEHLNELEMGALQECDTLLKKLGMKGSIFQSSSAPRQQQQQEEQQGAAQ